MSTLNVFWSFEPFDEDEQSRREERAVRTGRLTTEHAAAEDDRPVLVEDIGERVYHAGDLPAGSTLYIEAPPNAWPELAQTAVRAGFRLAHAAQTPKS